MKHCSLKGQPGVKTVVLASLLGLLATGAGATTLAGIYAAADRINQQAKESQAKVDELNSETRDLYQDYKIVLAEIENLRIYNRQLERQVAKQEAQIAEITDNMGKVSDIQRDVVPLMDRMVIGLEQLIENDMPFFTSEREERLENLRDVLTNPNVAVSEQFAQVLNAYQIENDYGRTMNAYTDEVDVGGTKRVVEVLQVGRVALMYQTTDGAETGFYNKRDRRWEVLDDSFQAAVRTGLRMAKKQAGQNLLPVPILVEG
ncbi:MAG: DUF3450 domain-containing protein [Gammaproteobacteria bacterium]|nr:DUF3450 domain-containing protein [Gammaproteobacteria bacterium]